MQHWVYYIQLYVIMQYRINSRIESTRRWIFGGVIACDIGIIFDILIVIEFDIFSWLQK